MNTKKLLVKIISAVIIICMLVSIAPLQVLAWKTKTHNYSAQLLIEEMQRYEENGVYSLDIPPFGKFTVPEEFSTAILTYPEAFRAGSQGPDAYPDLYIGQTYIHPFNSEHNVGSAQWIEALCKEVNSMPKGDQRNKALSFTLGFINHYCGDMFGHDYINSYAMGSFPEYNLSDLDEKAGIIVRHLSAETYMDSIIDPRYNALDVSAPTDFINGSIVFDGTIPNGLAEIYDYYGDDLPYHYKYILLLRNILSKSAESLRPKIDAESIMAVKYLDCWVEDVDRALLELVNISNDIAKDLLTSDKSTLDIYTDAYKQWFIDYGIYMSPTPDFLTDVVKATAKVIEIIGDAISSVVSTIFHLDKLKEMWKTFKEDLTNFAKKEIIRICESIGIPVTKFMNLLKEPNSLMWTDKAMTDYYADMEQFRKSASDAYGTATDQELAAFYNTLTMMKLVLIGSDNFSKLLLDNSGVSQNYYTKSTAHLTASSVKLTIETADKLFAGTDDNVYATVQCIDRETGRIYHSAKILLDKSFHNDLERGCIDTYTVNLGGDYPIEDLSVSIKKTVRIDDWEMGSLKVIPCQHGKEIIHNGTTLSYKYDTDTLFKNKTPKNFDPKFSAVTYETDLNSGILGYMESLDESGQWMFRENTLWNEQDARTEVFFKIFKGFAPTPSVSILTSDGQTQATTGDNVTVTVNLENTYNSVPRSRRETWLDKKTNNSGYYWADVTGTAKVYHGDIDSENYLGTYTVDNDGNLTFNVNNVATGIHEFTVVYSGDAWNAGETYRNISFKVYDGLSVIPDVLDFGDVAKADIDSLDAIILTVVNASQATFTINRIYAEDNYLIEAVNGDGGYCSTIDEQITLAPYENYALRVKPDPTNMNSDFITEYSNKIVVEYGDNHSCSALACITVFEKPVVDDDATATISVINSDGAQANDQMKVAYKSTVSFDGNFVSSQETAHDVHWLVKNPDSDNYIHRTTTQITNETTRWDDAFSLDKTGDHLVTAFFETDQYMYKSNIVMVKADLQVDDITVYNKNMTAYAADTFPIPYVKSENADIDLGKWYVDSESVDRYIGKNLTYTKNGMPVSGSTEANAFYTIAPCADSLIVNENPYMTANPDYRAFNYTYNGSTLSVMNVKDFRTIENSVTAEEATSYSDTTLLVDSRCIFTESSGREVFATGNNVLEQYVSDIRLVEYEADYDPLAIPVKYNVVKSVNLDVVNADNGNICVGFEPSGKINLYIPKVTATDSYLLYYDGETPSVYSTDDGTLTESADGNGFILTVDTLAGYTLCNAEKYTVKYKNHTGKTQEFQSYPGEKITLRTNANIYEDINNEDTYEHFTHWTADYEDIQFADDVMSNDLYSTNFTFIMPRHDVSFEAKYSKIYKLTVENGTGYVYGIVSNTALQEEPVAVLANEPSDGKLFHSWSATGIDLGDSKYDIQLDFAMPANDVTLTANFETGYTVTYDANGGSGTMDDTYVFADSDGSFTLTLPSSSFTAPQGKTFKAWAVNGEEYKAGDTVEINADTTATALWTDEFTVTFYSNLTDNQEVFCRFYPSDKADSEDEITWKLTQEGKIHPFYDIPATDGDNAGKYIFDGWYYDDGTPVDWNKAYSENTSVTAKWIEIGTVAKNAEDTKSTGSDTYKGFDLVGVQIRDIKEDDGNHYGTPGTGLRFVSVISESLLDKLGENAEYGYLIAKTATAATREKDASLFDDYKLVYNGEDVNGKNTTEEYEYVLNAKCSGYTDHFTCDDYRLFTTVITYDGIEGDSLTSAHASEITARAYIRYTDKNGLVRTYYNDYTGTNVYGGCSTSFDNASAMMNR